MKYRASKAFWLGNNQGGEADKVELGDLLDWNGDSAAVFKTQQVLYPDKDSFLSAVQKGWLEEVSEGGGVGWDEDPLEL